MAIALICGNTVHWKGAPSTPLISIATMKIINKVLKENNCEGVVTLTVGDKDIGE